MVCICESFANQFHQNRSPLDVNIFKAKTLKQRAIQASIWAFSGHLLSQLIRLGSNLIMTRLLLPEVFGIMAIANVIITGLNLFSDLGLRQNLVRSKRAEDPIYLNTLWTIQILRGLAIFSFGMVASLVFYVLGHFNLIAAGTAYADVSIPLVIAALSFNAVISGFQSTKLGLSGRQLDLGRVISIDICCQIAGIILMVAVAYSYPSVWALIVGSLFTSALKVLLSFIAVPGSGNNLHWDSDIFDEIFHFGKWIFLTSILGFLVNNGDRVLLGGLVDAKTFGLYAIAFLMIGSIQELFNKVIGTVAFPALSEVVRERPHDLKKTYYKFRLPIDIGTLLSAGLLFMAGHLVIDILYDERYKAAGRMFEILCISMVMDRYSLAMQSFMAISKPKLLVPVSTARLVLIYTGVPVAFHYSGLNGALWAIVASRVAVLPIIFYLKIKNHLFDLNYEVGITIFLLAGFVLGYLIKWLFA